MIYVFIFYRLIYLLKKKNTRARLHVSIFILISFDRMIGKNIDWDILFVDSIEQKKKKKRNGKTMRLTDKRMYISQEMHYRADYV